MKAPNERVILSDGKIGIVLQSKKHGTKLAIINRSDIEKVSLFHWSLIKAPDTFYAYTGTQLLHRFLLGITNSKIKVDHQNGNGLDCRRCNIRKASHSQNMWNSQIRKNNTSGYKGVTRIGHRWQAQICIYRKNIFLGKFNSPREAYKAYVAASKKYHKEFGRTF
jgi:hypothetical protein